MVAQHSSDTTPADSNSSGADAVAELQLSLAEKEQLVGVLTEQLEQAAEQLDRFQRSGSGLGETGRSAPTASSPGMSAEDLQLFEDWDHKQDTACLGRIEHQVSELRELLLDRATANASLSSATAQTTSAHTTPAAPAAGIQSAGSELTDSAWEAIKADLLGESPPEADTSSTHTQPARDQSSPPQNSASPPSEQAAAAAIQPHAGDQTASGSSVQAAPADDIDEVDVPSAIDLDNATPDALRDAVESRDGYISFLVHRLRRSGTLPSMTQVLSQVTCDSETVQALSELERRLEDQLRLSEIELSVERARLGRESRRLALRDQEHQEELEAAPDSTETEETRSNSRWRKFLG